LRHEQISRLSGLLLDEVSFLGLAAVICVNCELTLGEAPRWLSAPSAPQFNLGGSVFLLDQYITRREKSVEAEHPDLPDLPDLPVPAQFRQLFRGWADGKIHFVRSILSSGL
jgi:hypothetical protein